VEATIAGYLELLTGLAEAKGRTLGPLEDGKVARRLTAHDAELFASGVDWVTCASMTAAIC
jgi:hypothetical protein